MVWVGRILSLWGLCCLGLGFGVVWVWVVWVWVGGWGLCKLVGLGGFGVKF